MATYLPLSELLHNYLPVASEELKFKEKFNALLKEPNCFKRSNLEHHFTSSCWVTNANLDQVLLLHHTKLDRWLQPGGHADGNFDLIAVAKQELFEETNLQNFVNDPASIFDIDIHTIPTHRDVSAHEHFDARFHFIIEDSLSLAINEESKAFQWVPINNVSNLVNGDQSIMRMVHKTKLLDL